MGVRDEGNIFKGFRALGYVCNHVPLQVRYITRRRENLIATAVGNTFHTYGSSKLGLLSVGCAHPEDISCMTADTYHLYTAAGNLVKAWKRGTELKHTYSGHKSTVILMLPFGPHLITIDEGSNLKVWECRTESLYMELEFDPKSFKISALAHPNTYINKILLGSVQGTLQLWNLKSSTLIYNFKGWGSPVVSLEQAPAIDVVGVGLENGCVVIHNLRFDQTVMKLYQDYGPVVSLSFRSDGQPMMASGSPAGHVVLWNLEEKKLWHQLLNAHHGSVTGMKFLHNEPLLVTSSPDNSLKMWIFDMPDGQGRLLKLKEGHSAPPTRVRFYDPLGDIILSAGQDSCLKSFSTVMDLLNKNLGLASNNRKAVKKYGLKHNTEKLRPIINFSAELVEEKRFDNIIAVHRSTLRVSTWSFDKKKMGEHKLVHPRFKDLKMFKPVALCAEISACGNFVLIGYSTGHVDKYNIQSGIHRGTYATADHPNYKITDVKCDLLNTVVITGDSTGKMRFWAFKKPVVLGELPISDGITQFTLHKESNLLAACSDDFSVHIVDIVQRRVARLLLGHTNVVTDMAFSSDSRWLITSSMDRTIVVWDIPSGRCIDKMRVGVPCTSLSLSPTGEYLATTHVDNKGIYMWVNKCLYDYVSLNPVAEDSPPVDVCLPGVLVVPEDSPQIVEVAEEEYMSPQQLSDHLVTLSMLPESCWRNLLQLDVIRAHNKPKEPPMVPKSAPFFLPVVSGLQPQLDVQADSSRKTSDGGIIHLLVPTNLSNHLRQGDMEKTVDYLTSLGPAKIDSELRCLGPESGGSVELLHQFIKLISHLFERNKYFEVCQAWLGLLVKMHGDTLYSNPDLAEPLGQVQQLQQVLWERIQNDFNDCLCLVNYINNIKVL